MKNIFLLFNTWPVMTFQDSSFSLDLLTHDTMNISTAKYKTDFKTKIHYILLLKSKKSYVTDSYVTRQNLFRYFWTRQLHAF